MAVALGRPIISPDGKLRQPGTFPKLTVEEDL